jgi:membrane protease subunit HflK
MADSPTSNIDAEISEGAKSLMKTLAAAFFFLRILIFILLVVYLLSGVFYVDQDEQAYVVRWGKLDEQIRESGNFYFALPKPIDEVVRVPVRQAKTIVLDEFWYNEESNAMLDPSKPTAPPSGPLVAGTDGYLVSGDTNILHTKWSISYLIDKPIVYNTRYADPEEALRNAARNAVINVIGKHEIDEALFGGSEGIREEVENAMKQRVDAMNIGVKIRLVTFDFKVPPQSTIKAFTEVSEAVGDKSKKINDAVSYANELEQKAEGEKATIIAEAEAYKTELIAGVESEAKYFSMVLKEYEKAPDTMLLSLYADTLKRVMRNTEKYVINDGDKQQVRLHIGPELENPNTVEAEEDPNHDGHKD